MELNNLKSDSISPVQDPFNKDSLERVMIVIQRESGIHRNMYCYANVSFTNGKTSGEQKIGNHKEFKILMTELQAFIDTLT